MTTQHTYKITTWEATECVYPYLPNGVVAGLPRPHMRDHLFAQYTWAYFAVFNRYAPIMLNRPMLRIMLLGLPECLYMLGTYAWCTLRACIDPRLASKIRTNTVSRFEHNDAAEFSQSLPAGHTEPFQDDVFLPPPVHDDLPPGADAPEDAPQDESERRMCRVLIVVKREVAFASPHLFRDASWKCNVHNAILNLAYDTWYPMFELAFPRRLARWASKSMAILALGVWCSAHRRTTTTVWRYPAPITPPAPHPMASDPRVHIPSLWFYAAHLIYNCMFVPWFFYTRLFPQVKNLL